MTELVELKELRERLAATGYDPVDELRRMMAGAKIGPEMMAIVEQPSAALVLCAMTAFAQADLGVGVDPAQAIDLPNGFLMVHIDMAPLFEQFMKSYVAHLLEEHANVN